MGVESVDVAVVGGGISGIYTAWRLSSGQNPPAVALFDSSHRLGGRIDTVPLPVPEPGASAELGAMRFMPFMVMVKSLLEYLDIDTEVFPGQKQVRLFLRNVQVVLDGLGSAQNSPYNLLSGETQNAFQLTVKALNGTVPNAETLTTRQWLDVTRNGVFMGQKLWRWGMRNVAEELMSNEAFNFVYDNIGLDSIIGDTNAAIGTRALAGPLPAYLSGQVFRPVEGFGSLVARLEDRLGLFPSCDIRKRHRLMYAARDGEGIKLAFDSPEGTVEVAARRVVLAMPRRAIELIDLDHLFPPQCRDAERRRLAKKLGAVAGVPGFKFCLVYEKPWWQSFYDVSGAHQSWKEGNAVTDLPVRNILFGTGNGTNPAGNERVLLASYSDTDSARYWEGLAAVSPEMPRVGATSQYCQTGPGHLLTAIERQLCAVTQIADPLPEPLWAGYMNWEADPFGGSWHEWKPGIDVADALPDMRHPVEDLPLYVCGEAYSWWQGWIEGALMTAERMLQEHFRLSRPSEWLDPDYDLGP